MTTTANETTRQRGEREMMISERLLHDIEQLLGYATETRMWTEHAVREATRLLVEIDEERDQHASSGKQV